MHITTSGQFTAEELQMRRVALRDAIICVGWIKLLSIFCYVGLYLIVRFYSEGTWSTVIASMILVIIPLQAITGLLFFLGAVDIKVFPLKAAMWFCFLVAALNTVVGVIGAVYFIRTGYHAIHFLIAAYFAILSLSFFSVCCHDIIITVMFIKIIESPPPLPQDSAALAPI